MTDDSKAKRAKIEKTPVIEFNSEHADGGAITLPPVYERGAREEDTENIAKRAKIDEGISTDIASTLEAEPTIAPLPEESHIDIEAFLNAVSELSLSGDSAPVDALHSVSSGA